MSGTEAKHSSWWLYTEQDDAGVVVDAPTPQAALSAALDDGWDPEDAEVWAYPLPDLPIYLGRVDS